MGIIVRYLKVLIPEFGIETGYGKVSIPEKVMIPTTSYEVMVDRSWGLYTSLIQDTEAYVCGG